MITFDTFLLGLMIVSSITSLVTEGLKKILAECNVTYRANSLASIVAVVMAMLIGIGYIVLMNITFDASIVVYLVALAIGGWLCAMVGYDKVIQGVGQFKTNKEE